MVDHDPWAMINMITRSKFKHALWKKKLWTRQMAYDEFLAAQESAALEYMTRQREKENG